MEKYTKYLKNKKVIFGLVIVGLIILNALFGKDCQDKESCSDEQATIQHICSGACDHGLNG